MKLQVVFEAAAILLITSEFARAQDSDITRRDCGWIARNDTGTIKPPTDTNGYYFPLETCRWTIPVKTGYTISLVAVKFDLTEKDDSIDRCYDYVSINSNRMCGHKEPGQKFGPFEKNVEIMFVSDNEYQSKGFEIHYEHTKIPVCDRECENGGTCYADNACFCPDGYYGFVCTYYTLTESALIEVNAVVELSTFSSCIVYGQKNIRTFDAHHYHLDGSCEYALAEFGDVKITVTMHLPEDEARNGIKSLSVTRDLVHTVHISRGYSDKMEAFTENGRTLDLPEFFGPFEVTKKYGKIRVRDDDFDLIVDEDGSAADLTMRRNLETRGLCGNSNGDPDDDMQTISGNQATSIAMFESSWSQGVCTASTSDVELIGDAWDVESICHQMRTGSFEPCLSKISTTRYIEACTQDLRLCSYMSRTGCECPSFTQFERDCAAKNFFISPDWRKDRCGITCPANQIFSDCAPSSPSTCKNLGSNYKSESPCTDGCTCPKGMYWDVELCVEVSNCSCYVGEVVYSSGEKLVEQCRNCTCENGKLACDDTPCGGTGIAFGNPHYLTFDGLWYTYDGVCEYTLLRIVKELDILVKSEKCGTESGFTCIEGITINSPSFGIVLLQSTGEVKVANEAVELPHVIYNTLEIRQLTSLYVSVHLVQLGVWLRWNPDGIVFVNVPESLKGKISGMLGNFNDETTDEYISPDGIVQRTVQQFGSSWSAGDQCSEIQTTGTETCILSDNDRELCQNAIYHHEPFKNCIGSTRHEVLIKKFCQEAICAARSEKEKQRNICDSISVFATLCAVKGHISNWRNETFCNLPCLNGKIYEPWTSSCGRTCRGITEEDVCSASVVQEGCVCPFGMFEDHTGNCVQESECRCYFENKWRNNEEFFIHNSKDCFCKGGVVTCTGTPVANCTGDMIYTRCTGGETGANCQPTCANKNPTCGQECEKGCACPIGTFYDAGKTRCITEDECECTFEGKRHQTGERVIDDCDHCLCDHGQWNCQRTTLCSRTCDVVSGSYFKTFDAAHFRSRGTCTYKLMTDACTVRTDSYSFFDITMKSHPCDGSDYTMCNLTIQARFGNKIFTLTRGEDVKISALDPIKAVFMDVRSTDYRLGFHQVIEADFPKYYIQLSYDRKSTLKIDVSKNITSPIFGRKLCGLCGDLDESSANDFNTKNGETDPANFINSWSLEENCGELKPAEENACHGNAKAEENARQQCKIMKSSLFKECHEKIDVGSYYDLCVEETCSCDTGGECECFCTSVAAYANECGRRGAKVNWRPVTSCPVECEEFTDPTGDLCDIKYDPCNSCVKTCCHQCTRGCFEGCFPKCPEGKVFDSDNQTCVEESECVCRLPITRSYTTAGMTSTAYTEITSIVTEATTVSATETTAATATTTSVTATETTTANLTAPTAATTATTIQTTRPCKHGCSYEENGVTVQKKIGDVWEFDCRTATCKGDEYGCAYQDQIPLVCPTIYCKDYEEEIPAGSKSCCSSCQCKYCLYEGKNYSIAETWKVGECVTMECTEGSCPNGTVTEDKGENCNSGPTSCREFYELTTDNTDLCCPKRSCVCNVSLCPTGEACVGGSKIDRERSNDCCEVQECLPVCSYEGKEFKNGSQIRKTDCYEDYCRCTEDSCSIYTENDRRCPPNPDCTNTDTNHYRHIVSADGCCRTSNCKCECRVYGDPHYTTFDGRYYPFHGVCNYMLVTYRDSDELQIIGDNARCSPEIDSVSCLKEVTVIWRRNTIVLGAGNFITLDGAVTPYSELPKSYHGVSVKTKGQGVRLTIPAILLTLNFEHINDVSSVFIEVPMTSWFNKTVGLCGTCTNTRDDDFETKVGEKSEHSDDFASSWQYNTTEKDCLPCNPPNRKECWNCSDPRHGEDIPEYCDKNCGKICSALKNDIFSNCTREKEVYFQNCLFDEEYTPKCSVCKSSAIRAYADECDCVKWREAFNCTPTCPKGQVYKECVSECELEKSCDNLDEELACIQENSRGCGCPAGLVRKSVNSDECVEKKCCSCADPICKEYQELSLVDGEDPTDCCAEKYCKCKAVDTIECALPKVLNRTDDGTPGCWREECVCPADPTCPDMRNCSAPGCQKIPTYGECNCVESVECACDSNTCTKMDCAPCSRLNKTYQAPNSELPCGGNCCPTQECVPITCSEPPNPILPDYPTADCPFIKRVPTSYDPADTDECCPQSYDIQCASEHCDVITSPLSCRDGFDLIVKPLNASNNATIRNFASCPMVDKCCTYKECVCTSCLAEFGLMRLGQEPVYIDDGCIKVSCVKKESPTAKTADGYYTVTREEPTCPEETECPCYKQLETAHPAKGAKNSSQWLDLCCPKYRCVSSCSPRYNPGPEDCFYPAVKEKVYEEAKPGCPNINCPMTTCKCSLCVDSNNNTHALDTTYEGDNPCENFTCKQSSDELCPQPEKKEAECSKKECNVYEQLIQTSNEGDCCPKQECKCKPYEELQHVCANWKNNASVCPDEENMVLRLDGRKYQDDFCCPEKLCECKEESARNCVKGPDCLPNHDKIQKATTDDTKCCPEYDCVCNCSHIKCPYSSWKVQNDDDSCTCSCSCDPELCPTPKPPTCPEHQYWIQNGTEHDGCCPVYGGCVCNYTSCPSIPSAKCTEYQEEYEWFSDPEACCPHSKKCKCNQDPLVLTKLCNESRHDLPQNCTYGTEPYIAEVMANKKEDLCCGVGCRCISCTTDSGEIKLVGEKWEEEKDCKKLRHVCSNEKRTNNCHKISTEETPIQCNHTSALEYQYDNCKSGNYAVETTPQTQCCPEYKCVPCQDPTVPCKITETRLANETHILCPGGCTCSKNLTNDQLKWCKNGAICGEHQKAVFVEEGTEHKDECCPNYTCTCSECPSETLTEEKVLANKSLCEKVGVRQSDVNRTCCQNYEVQCDESCTCDEFPDRCNSTVGCFAETEHNTCDCVSSVTCECRPDDCPKKKCRECYQLTSEAREANPGAACSGNCCPVEECVRKPCDTIPEPMIPPECVFLKKIEEFGDDRCCAEKKNLACNGSCPIGIAEESCDEGYDLVTVPAANSSDPAISALSHCSMIDECCPHKICVCNSCPYPDGVMKFGDSPVYSQDGCTKYSCNRETKMENGCYKISRQTPDCVPPPDPECYQKRNTIEARKGVKNMEEWDDLCCPQYSIDNSSCTDAYRPGLIECEFPSVRHITYETNEGCENKNCPIAKCTCDKCVDSKNESHAVGTVYPGETHCENFTCRAAVEGETCPKGSVNSVYCPSTPCNTSFENKNTENILGECCPVESCVCKSEEMLQYVCNDWIHNTSYCPDPDHMELVITGSTLQHSCCPAKTCQCKSMENRNCQKGEKPVECDIYQYKHDVYESPQDCCAIAECRCKNDSELDSEFGCNQTCPDGYQKTYVDPVTKCCGKCDCNTCRTVENGTTKIIPAGKSWQEKEGACSVTKMCSVNKLEDGCNGIEPVYSEKDNCQSKDDYEKECDKLEVAITLRHLQYECCPRFQCRCTENDTILSELCDQHNGIQCSEYKIQAYLGEFECCNTYECQCKDCEYYCPPGLIEQKNATQMNATTDDCCNEYSCVCDKRACQEIDEYEATNCNSPYQIAVTTPEFLDSYSCCAKYKCECKNPAENCPSPRTCLASQEPVAHGKHTHTSDCCDEYICKCRSPEELNTVCEYHENYTCDGDGLVREIVASQDPCCTNFTCTCNPTTCPNIEYKCRLGYERYDAGGDGCCPDYKCRCTYCVSDGVEHAINSSWTESSCQTLMCTERRGECPIVEARQKYHCEIVDEEDCTKRGGIIRGTDESDNCCKECTLCKRVQKMQNLTMTINGAEYLSLEEIDIGRCQGACPTIVDVNPLTGYSEPICACCEPTITKIAVFFEGVAEGKYNAISREVSVTESCKCTNENLVP